METEATIVAWARETFGAPKSHVPLVKRLQEEFSELEDAFHYWGDGPAPRETDEAYENECMKEILDEVCDLYIVAVQVCAARGHTLHELIDQKMDINRKRQWMDVAGSWQHVENLNE